MTETEARVILNAINLGNSRIRKLVEYFGSARELLSLNPKNLSDHNILSPETSRKISEFPKDNFLKSEYNLITRHHIQVVTEEDEEYPQALREIPDAPVVLYILGKINPRERLAMAMVGSRLASVYGLAIAERFASQLAELGITIVSGLARGIDSAAHRGALKANGKTIAVLGCGLAEIYPTENKDLARQIAQQGAVISEFPMTMEPMRYNFPRRNRIVSGLSLGVIVVEAHVKSGALITAEFALEQGREVFAIPGKVDHPGSKGVHRLIKEGAKLATCIEDILEELKVQLRPLVTKEEDAVPERIHSSTELSPEEEMVYKFIEKKPVYIDELIDRLHVSVGDLTNALLGLELKQRIKKLTGNFFVRT